MELICFTLHSSVVLSITSVLLFSFIEIVTCDPLAFLTDALYSEVEAKGKKLKFHQIISGALTATECARTCTIRRAWAPACQAFSFNRTENTCALYVTGPKIIVDPDLRIFVFPKKDRFHTISVGNEIYSIAFQSEKLRMRDAKKKCRSLGGKLLELDSLGKYAALRTIQPDLRLANVWIGANDLGVEGEWVTEEEGHPINSSTWLWDNGQPRGGKNVDCATIFIQNLKMKAEDCSERHQFLCEKPL